MAGPKIDVSSFLNKEYFVIHTTTVVPREKMMPLLQEHLESQVRLEKEGIMFAAGPFFNEEGQPIGGMFIVRADSFEKAREIADADPLHKAGYRTYTIHRWIMNEGSFSINLRYSDQTFQLE